ncbi:MAG: hypothetical protein FWG70_03415 [Oscillospiraceae bacterium]|nr:hypothetical protein [Oscillospiraceae bacterium]
MKVTKIIALIIALAMSLTLAACSDEASSNTPNNQNTNAETPDNNTPDNGAEPPDNGTETPSVHQHRMQAIIDNDGQVMSNITSYFRNSIGNTFDISATAGDGGDNILVLTFSPSKDEGAQYRFQPRSVVEGPEITADWFVAKIEERKEDLPYAVSGNLNGDFVDGEWVEIEDPVLVIELVDTAATVWYRAEITENGYDVTLALDDSEPDLMYPGLKATIINNSPYEFSLESILLTDGELACQWWNRNEALNFVLPGEVVTFKLNYRRPGTKPEFSVRFNHVDLGEGQRFLSYPVFPEMPEFLPPGSTITIDDVTQYIYTEPGYRDEVALVYISAVGPDGEVIDIPAPEPPPQFQLSDGPRG